MQVLDRLKMELSNQEYFTDEQDEITIIKAVYIKLVNISCQSGMIKTEQKTTHTRRWIYGKAKYESDSRFFRSC